MWVLLGWLAFGVLAAAIMRLRGHDSFAWAWLFLVLGPLAVPVAISADRHRPPEPSAGRHEGVLDVLVAHDGSPEAEAALDATLALLGSHLTSLTLAAVMDFEAPTTVRGREESREEQRRLDAVARAVELRVEAPVDTIVLLGKAGHALQHFAGTHGYDLIVAGSHMAKRMHLRSRPPKDLAVDSSTPVFIGPRSR